MIKQREDAGICRNKNEKAIRKEKITIQLEEINQKVLAKEATYYCLRNSKDAAKDLEAQQSYFTKNKKRTGNPNTCS